MNCSLLSCCAAVYMYTNTQVDRSRICQTFVRNVNRMLMRIKYKLNHNVNYYNFLNLPCEMMVKCGLWILKL